MTLLSESAVINGNDFNNIFRSGHTADDFHVQNPSGLRHPPGHVATQLIIYAHHGFESTGELTMLQEF